ncbi:uncharacterized protein LOC143195915 [Rhynchophorus ferrugineus]|uniref:Non-homologous end-joining factor 1 n=1 Tax=Rhynchophorus ferrugineus TaxID=354439 RepID=A0A834HS73_RHYFE|nr:hypothetical protein GWI33_019050 [Rhynchophorus ferrugineus]
MWKTFTHLSNPYLFRCEIEEDSFDLYLTNLENIWKCSSTDMELMESFKENNPLIEATSDVIKSDLLSIINAFDNESISIVNEGNENCKLSLTRKSTNIADDIVYSFFLKPCKEKFKQEVTIPFIKTIYYLEKQKEHLLKLLKMKDREIREYKVEHGEISRDELKTEEVDIIESNANYLVLKVFQETSQFWKEFAQQNGQVEMTSKNLEPEPWNATNKRRKLVYKRKENKSLGIRYKK